MGGSRTHLQSLSDLGRSPSSRNRYFSNFTLSKAILYLLAILYVALVAIIATFEPFITTDPPCQISVYTDQVSKFENPGYEPVPCYHHERFFKLLFLTREECSFARRLVAAVVMGGLIGWERREADRPAGIRTMALVSLGSCLFTINSAYAFVTGPMNWDASRISAAIPSGVGFLGAGLIFKKEEKKDDSEQSTHVVHGLTTAASLWLSAAVGIACGGELYFAATFGTFIMMLLLRFGPRQSDVYDEDEQEGELQIQVLEDDNVDAEEQQNKFEGDHEFLDESYQSIRQSEREVAALLKKSNANRRKSLRSRPSLATDV